MGKRMSIFTSLNKEKLVIDKKIREQYDLQLAKAIDLGLRRPANLTIKDYQKELGYSHEKIRRIMHLLPRKDSNDTQSF